MSEQTDLSNALRSTFLLAKAPDSLIEKLVTHSKSEKLSKGQIIIIHDDPAEHFFFIKKGWIKTYRESEDGHQSIVDILHPGQLFAEDSAFDDSPYAYTAEATEDSEILSMPISLLSQNIQTSPDMARHALRYISLKQKQKIHEIEHMTLQSAAQKIGCFILRLLKPNQTETINIETRFPYDKTLVAAKLGIQPETFSRALKKLKDTANLSIKGSAITIHDLNALSQFTCSACSAKYPCKDRQ